MIGAASPYGQTKVFCPNVNLEQLCNDLRPLTSQLDQAISRYTSIAHVLKNNCGLQVHEVILGGSTAKGTSIRCKLEIDIVVLLKDYHPSKVPQYLNCFEKYIQVNFKVKPPTRRIYSINFLDGDVEVDLLPGGCNATPQTFLQMPVTDAAYWAASITKLQVDLLRKQPGHLKDLVRLAKCWRNEGKATNVLTVKSAPKSYLLEVLALAASKDSSNITLGHLFRGLLRLIVRVCEEPLEVFSYHYYDAGVLEYSRQLGRLSHHCGSFVIDPANPTNNLWATLEDPSTLCIYARHTLANMCTTSDLENLFDRCAQLSLLYVDLSQSPASLPMVGQCVKDLGYYFREPSERKTVPFPVPADGITPTNLPAPAREACEWMRTMNPTQRPKTFGALIRALETHFNVSPRIALFQAYWLQRCHFVTDFQEVLARLRFLCSYRDPTILSANVSLMWRV